VKKPSAAYVEHPEDLIAGSGRMDPDGGTFLI
jgi:hypothetical protein